MENSRIRSRGFWTIVELAWLDAERPSQGTLRSRILSRRVRDVDAAMAPFFDALSRVLARELSRDALAVFVADFDRHVLRLKTTGLEKQMKARDLAFLAGRLRTVALGERHYQAVLKDPRAALVVTDADKTITALWRMYDVRFPQRCEPSPNMRTVDESGGAPLRASA